MGSKFLIQLLWTEDLWFDFYGQKSLGRSSKTRRLYKLPNGRKPPMHKITLGPSLKRRPLRPSLKKRRWLGLFLKIFNRFSKDSRFSIKKNLWTEEPWWAFCGGNSIKEPFKIIKRWKIFYRSYKTRRCRINHPMLENLLQLSHA